MEAKLKKFRSLRSRKISKDNISDTKPKRKINNFGLSRMFKNMGLDEEEVLLIENDEPLPVKQIQRKEKLNEVIPQVNEYIPELNEVRSETRRDDVVSEVSETETLEEENPVSWQYCIIKYSTYALIWLSFFIFFINLQFGAVYFGVTALIFICLNTRTKPKKKGEVSAYSVFNEDCTSIDGTLNAEDLQRQLLYGSLPVKIF